MQTLVFLAQRQSQVITREQFFDTVWQGLVVNEEALSRAISLLRSALKDKAKRPRYIQTIPGVGYRLIASVQPLASTESHSMNTAASEVVGPAGSEQPQGRRWLQGSVWGLLLLVGIVLISRLLPGIGSNGPNSTAGDSRKTEIIQSASADENSLAVLPFVNMSEDSQQEFMADGMTEELLNLLTKVPELRVTARTSSFFFKGKNLPVRQIGEILNVKYLLEGSIRRSGGNVRVTAQLIDALTDKHLWSESYDFNENDIFIIQDNVATAIVQALSNSLGALSRKPVARSSSLAAFEAYRTGRLIWWRRTPADFEEAIRYFNLAIEKDPGFAPAYAALADSWMLLVMHGNAHIAKGEEIAEKSVQQALALDPESHEAYAALGLTRLIAGRKTEAEAALRRAIELDDTYVPAYLWLAVLLGDHGRIIEQGEVLRTAMAMDPLNEMLAVYYAENLRLSGDLEGGLDTLESLIRLQPDHPRLLVAMSETLLAGGQLAEAVQFAQLAYEQDPNSVFVINAMAEAWKQVGELDQAEVTWLRGLEHNNRSVELKVFYLGMLLMEKRSVDARELMDNLFPKDINVLSAGYQRTYHWFMGQVCDVEGNLEGMRDHFEQVIDPDERQHYDREQVYVLTQAALVNQQIGATEAAEKQLQTAERALGHARINGIDDADFYYATGSLLAMRGDRERALQSLHQAYKKGFRSSWLMQQDRRLNSLRDEPGFMEILEKIGTDLEVERQVVLNSATQLQ